MTRLVLVAVALLAVGGFADPVKYVAPKKIVDKAFLKKQMELITLFYHIHEPLLEPDMQKISQTWSLEQNMELFKEVKYAKVYSEMLKNGWILPRAVPFSIWQPQHQFEAKTLYFLLFNSKDYETFFKTAVYLRDRVNEGLYVYSLSIAIMNFPETQGIIIPPIYEIFPSFFFNGQILTTAQRINTHGKRNIDYYPGTYVWEDNVVIKWNETVWPYYYNDFHLKYYTEDFYLNAVYYNNHLTYPFWLSGNEKVSTTRMKRGEYFWFFHKQYLTFYYMERLSNDLGEIPELDFDVVQDGFSSGLLYHNGIPFPSRPSHFNLDQPRYAEYISLIKEYESRIRNAIDLGFFISKTGEKIDLRSSNAIDLLGSTIEANVDSANPQYYKDFIGLWRYLLSNSVGPSQKYVNGVTPLVVPGVLDHYQTCQRDPAFYMIWKRVLNLFNLWSSYLPAYTEEELSYPVAVERVEVDKLVTYFENVFVNVTNHLFLTEAETKSISDDVKVLVQQPILNHKPFNIRLHVKSDVAKTVVVRFFLAPKYDSKGVEIPLHLNTKNFFLFDQFVYELPAGESVILRESNKNMFMIDKWSSGIEVYEAAFNAYHGKGEFVIDESEFFVGYPRHLMIPKGRIGGMPFLFLAYISEYKAPVDPFGTGSNPAEKFGIGTGSRRMTSYPLNFPLDRPLHQWQIENLKNFYFEDVFIYHKPTPEMYYPFH